MKIKQDFETTKQNFTAWWNHQDIGRPLVRIVGFDPEKEVRHPVPSDFEALHMNAQYRVQTFQREQYARTYFGEGFPYVDLNMGPGSMAAYLGGEPVFDADTVWYRECIGESGVLSDLGKLVFQPENKWWKKHLEQVQICAQLLKGTPVYTAIPDILENIDILALLRKPQDLCYDLIDEPEQVAAYIGQIDDLYLSYYEPMYQAVKDETGGCCYTAFSIWAPGRCAKIQCDFSALMSPGQFDDFILPSLQKQCDAIDDTMYHLDGPDAIRHLPSVLSIERLNALQWTPGVAEKDGGDEKWYPIYDKALDAGKSVWILMEQGNVDDWIARSRNLVRRYGTRGLYFVYRDMPIADACRLYDAAERKFQVG